MPPNTHQEPGAAAPHDRAKGRAVATAALSGLVDGATCVMLTVLPEQDERPTRALVRAYDGDGQRLEMSRPMREAAVHWIRAAWPELAADASYRLDLTTGRLATLDEPADGSDPTGRA